jgi:hypothetical protein
LRTATEPSLSRAISTQLPVEPLRRLLRQLTPSSSAADMPLWMGIGKPPVAHDRAVALADALPDARAFGDIPNMHDYATYAPYIWPNNLDGS